MIWPFPRPHPPMILRPKRPLERPLMTIAAGFRCQNGIVLCADSQYTAWYGKYYGAKLFGAFPKNGVVMTAFAGLTDHMGEVKDKIEKSVEGVEVSVDGIKSLVCSLLNAYQPPEGEMFQMLTAFHLKDGGHYLFASNRVADMPATWFPVNHYECVGSGASPLIHYLVRLFERLPAFSIEQAGILGMYLVRQAEKYGEGVGGEAQICALNEQGVMVAPYRGLVEEKEKLLKGEEYDLALLLSSLIDDRVSEDDFDKTLKTLCSRMKDFRRNLRECPMF